MGGEYSVDSCNGILTLILFMINFISQVCPVLQLIIMINCLPWTLDHCLSSLAALSTCTLETTTLERGHHHILFHFWHTNTEQQKGLREDDYWKGFLRFNVQVERISAVNSHLYCTIFAKHHNFSQVIQGPAEIFNNSWGVADIENGPWVGSSRCRCVQEPINCVPEDEYEVGLA